MRERENAEQRYKPWETQFCCSLQYFFEVVFEWLFLATATLFKTFCLMTDIRKTLKGSSHLYF